MSFGGSTNAANHIIKENARLRNKSRRYIGRNANNLIKRGEGERIAVPTASAQDRARFREEDRQFRRRETMNWVYTALSVLAVVGLFYYLFMITPQ